MEEFYALKAFGLFALSKHHGLGGTEELCVSGPLGAGVLGRMIIPRQPGMLAELWWTGFSRC